MSRAAAGPSGEYAKMKAVPAVVPGSAVNSCSIESEVGVLALFRGFASDPRTRASRPDPAVMTSNHESRPVISNVFDPCSGGGCFVKRSAGPAGEWRSFPAKIFDRPAATHLNLLSEIP